MAEYLAPGVYVEEVPSGNKPIAGVGTSTAGFVGATERGPLEPQFIPSLLEFQKWYGGYQPKLSYLAYAIEGFFANGGQRCFVARVTASNATLASGKVNSLNVVAIGPGDWGNQVSIKVEKSSQAKRAEAERAAQDPPPPTKPQESWIKLTIEYKDGDQVKASEVFDDLTHDPFASNNLAKTINMNSQLVRVWWENDTPVELALPPADPVALAGGSDGNSLSADHYKGEGLVPPAIAEPAVGAPPEDILSLAPARGLNGLRLIDEVALVIVPDEVHDGLGGEGAKITDAVVTHCSEMKDRFAILSTKAGQNTVNDVLLPTDTTYAAFYYPWIKVSDPTTNGIRPIPPSGHVAGIYARSDIERGVHKAPANEVVRGAMDLEFPVTKAMQDILNPRSVNCMRDFRSDGRGIRVWGARTMSSDPEWKYVNVRRLFLMIEESIDEATQWVVFELNDEGTWADVERAVSNFLRTQWLNGALMGATPDQAYFVACNRTTMTQDDIDNGRLICVVGIAPVKPAEFVIFRISQKTAEAA